MVLKYLITGTARSGTGFMAELFNSNGIPCTHEKVFRVANHTLPEYYNVTGRVRNKTAESSWLAAPFVEELVQLRPQLKVVQVVRDPIKVIQSFLDLEFFSSKANTFKGPKKIIAGYTGRNHNDVDACIAYILKWYSFMDKIPEKVVVNLDDMDYNSLSELVGIEIKPLDRVINDKSHAKRKHHSREEVFEKVSKSAKYFMLKDLAAANNIILEV